MVLRRFSAFLCLAVALCVIEVVAFAHRVADVIHLMIAAVASPFNPALALEGPGGLVTDSPGRALDRALQNGLRHEAGFSRRSAARHI